MKYTILGFNQEKVCSIFKEVKIDGVRSKIYKLDVIDLVILQEIADFMNRKNIIKYTMNDKIFFSITHKSILQDLPLLDIKKQALKDRIDKMCFLGLIEKQVARDENGTWVGYRLTDVYESLTYSTNEEGGGGVFNYTGGCSELHVGVVSNYTPNINNTINEINIEKENIKEREKKKNELELPDYIAPEYRDVMTEWLEYKKERRESYKSRGLKQCYDKLVKFSNGNPATALEIIHSAMSNNYSGFFPLRNMAQSKLTPYEQQQLERQQYTAMFEQRIFDNISTLDDEDAGCGRLPDDI